MRRVVLDSSTKYIDSKGNLFKSRLELTISKLLTFLGQHYEHNFSILLSDGSVAVLDFKVGDKYIEVLDTDEDMEKFERVRKENPSLNLIGVGASKYAEKAEGLNFIAISDTVGDHIGSIFIEDPSLAFDYAHILPLVEKCSILHGHTSTVMVEIIGKMTNNLVIDFSEAKKLVKDALSNLDHKFFINEKYLQREDSLHYFVSFEGPRGLFNLQLPKSTTFLLTGEATVENLSSIIINILASKMPPNIEALGVYIYEGVNKGAHILANIR
jgi:6-pyruvoyltetrahydropterin/6-carboxytetrahydropterin synthase